MKAVKPGEAERAAVRELVKAARARGEDLTGPDGLLKSITKTVLESALEEEMTEHLGSREARHPGRGRQRQHPQRHPAEDGADRRRRRGDDRGAAGPGRHVRAGHRQEAAAAPDRRRRGRDLVVRQGIDHRGDLGALRRGVRRVASPRTPSAGSPTRCVEDMQAWSSRPLQGVYAAIFIDAIYVKVRDGQVGNQPFYAAIGVDLDGHRDVLGLWAGHGGGESAKFWMNVLTDLKNRGVTDVFFVVCDGLKGLPDAVTAVFPAAIVQACVIHLIRATLRYASRKYWDQLARDLRAIYTAPTAEAAWAAFEELEEKWGKPYPAIPQAVAGGVGGVHPVPRLRRRDQAGSLLHQRDRVPQRQVSQGGRRAGALPDRAGRAQDACTWSPEVWTPKASGRHDGSHGGSRH